MNKYREKQVIGPVLFLFILIGLFQLVQLKVIRIVQV